LARQGLGTCGAGSCKRQRRWYSSLQCHSDEETGGVTRRPNPKRARGAILAFQKGRRHGERPPGFRESVLLRGRRRNESLGQLGKPSTLALKRSSGARRGGRDSKSFAAAGWRQGTPGGESRRGTHAKARVLHSTPSAPKGSRGQPRWRLRVYAFNRIFLARCGMTASSETDTPPTQENAKPREGRDDPMRARISALEGVPVRRI